MHKHCGSYDGQNEVPAPEIHRSRKTQSSVTDVTAREKESEENPVWRLRLIAAGFDACQYCRRRCVNDQERLSTSVRKPTGATVVNSLSNSHRVRTSRTSYGVEIGA